MIYYKLLLILTILATVILAIWKHHQKEYTEANYLVGWAVLVTVVTAMTPN